MSDGSRQPPLRRSAGGGPGGEETGEGDGQDDRQGHAAAADGPGGGESREKGEVPHRDVDEEQFQGVLAEGFQGLPDAIGNDGAVAGEKVEEDEEQGIGPVGQAGERAVPEHEDELQGHGQDGGPQKGGGDAFSGHRPGGARHAGPEGGNPQPRDFGLAEPARGAAGQQQGEEQGREHERENQRRAARAHPRGEQVQGAEEGDVPIGLGAVSPEGERGPVVAKGPPRGMLQDDVAEEPIDGAHEQVGQEHPPEALAVETARAGRGGQRVKDAEPGEEQEDVDADAADRAVVRPRQEGERPAGMAHAQPSKGMQEHDAADRQPEQFPPVAADVVPVRRLHGITSWAAGDVLPGGEIEVVEDRLVERQAFFDGGPDHVVAVVAAEVGIVLAGDVEGGAVEQDFRGMEDVGAFPCAAEAVEGDLFAARPVVLADLPAREMDDPVAEALVPDEEKKDGATNLAQLGLLQFRGALGEEEDVRIGEKALDFPLDGIGGDFVEGLDVDLHAQAAVGEAGFVLADPGGVLVAEEGDGDEGAEIVGRAVEAEAFLVAVLFPALEQLLEVFPEERDIEVVVPRDEIVFADRPDAGAGADDVMEAVLFAELVEIGEVLENALVQEGDVLGLDPAGASAVAAGAVGFIGTLLGRVVLHGGPFGGHPARSGRRSWRMMSCPPVSRTRTERTNSRCLRLNSSRVSAWTVKPATRSVLLAMVPLKDQPRGRRRR